jgi:hypothetical protein
MESINRHRSGGRVVYGSSSLYPIVQCVLRDNNLPYASTSSHESVCDSCQKPKSHQLPYSRSNSVSSSPLELIYSDVWVLPRFSWQACMCEFHR